MRSKRNSALIAGAVASGSMLVMAISSASAQAVGGGINGPGTPGASSPYTYTAGVPSPYASGGAVSPYSAGVPSSYGSGAPAPYNPRPAVSAASYGSPQPASRTMPYPSGPGPYGAMLGPGASRGAPIDRAFTPASASVYAPAPTRPPGARPTAPATPAWASTSASAPEKKPSALRRMFSFLWHGGSSRQEEATARPIYRDLATGRTDLPGARPWTAPAPR
jgi:hypothetical protein